MEGKFSGILGDDCMSVLTINLKRAALNNSGNTVDYKKTKSSKSHAEVTLHPRQLVEKFGWRVCMCRRTYGRWTALA
jgi:hypothetical protein